jgi:hypothetical protein
MESSDDEFDDEALRCYNCCVDIDEYDDDAFYDDDIDKYFCKECYEFIQVNR